MAAAPPPPSAACPRTHARTLTPPSLPPTLPPHPSRIGSVGQRHHQRVPHSSKQGVQPTGHPAGGELCRMGGCRGRGRGGEGIPACSAPPPPPNHPTLALQPPRAPPPAARPTPSGEKLPRCLVLLPPPPPPLRTPHRGQAAARRKLAPLPRLKTVRRPWPPRPTPPPHCHPPGSLAPLTVPLEGAIAPSGRRTLLATSVCCLLRARAGASAIASG